MSKPTQLILLTFCFILASYQLYRCQKTFKNGSQRIKKISKIDFGDKQKAVNLQEAVYIWYPQNTIEAGIWDQTTAQIAYQLAPTKVYWKQENRVSEAAIILCRKDYIPLFDMRFSFKESLDYISTPLNNDFHLLEFIPKP